MACDGVTDLIRGYSDRQAEVLVTVLLWLACHESDEIALEAELNAAAELAANRDVDPKALQEVRMLDPGKLTLATSEHYTDLVSLIESP